jgi:hypothetical protein
MDPPCDKGTLPRNESAKEKDIINGQDMSRRDRGGNETWGRSYKVRPQKSTLSLREIIEHEK